MPMGARPASPLVRAAPPQGPPVLLVVLFVLSNTFRAFADPGDTDTLVKFKSSLVDMGALRSWNPATPPCSSDRSNWNGVLCWDGHIWGLQLESMGLTGQIHLDSLVALPFLRTLSFRNNSLDGPFPRFNKLSALKSLYLSDNLFAGDIDDNEFAGMNYLKKVMLNGNRFTGKIPSSLAALPRLIKVRLDGNQFVGSIPKFRHKGLKLVNVSNNGLAGPIPESFSKMSPSLFSGNEDLCGMPIEPCTPAAPPAQPPGVQHLEPGFPSVAPKKSSGTKIAMTVLAVALAFVVMALIIILCYHKEQKSKLDRIGSFDDQRSMVPPTVEHVRHVPENPKNLKKAELGKLTFVRDDRERFDLQDLLRSSAEVLGSGNFGASYKAVIFREQAMVVKRFKLMNNVGREEFQEHMRRIGRLSHQNLLPIVAYYFRKEEKLLVFDFVQNGSLASHLHGNHTKDRGGLDWPTRLKVIKGVVKGMAYLYSELPSLMLPHGHLKSSNVLLNESFEPLLMDYALVPLINPESASQLMVAYKSPEYAQLGRTLKKTDVWSIGILILEVLTGRFPASYITQGSRSDTDLVNWVSSIVRDKSTAEVFDKDMRGRKHAEGEMQKLLSIGLAACEEEVERRLELRELVKGVEELKESHYDG